MSDKNERENKFAFSRRKSPTGIDRRVLVSGMAAMPALSAALATAAHAQAASTRSGFSFAACGDSRPMMYLPYNEGKPDL